MIEEEYWYWLCNIDEMWQGKIKNIIERFETPEKVYYAKAEQFEGIPGINCKDIERIVNSREYISSKLGLDYLEKKNIKFIHLGHKEYPKRLETLTDKPYSLYVKGNLPPEDKYNIAVVGARACTGNGKETARQIGKVLTDYGIGTISGMARGIDSFSHKGTLESGGNTYAVLGCGIDICYPRENIELYDQIIHNGGVISEYPLGSRPIPWRFPHRNRLISGLSDGIVIVEAKERSGSLITINFALEQGKEIFAVPGRINDPLSSGCNRLIKSGAVILTKPLDILEELGIDINNKCEQTVNNNYMLEKELEVVYSCLSLLPKNFHTIIEETEMKSSDLFGILVRLQLMGLIDEPIKSHYIKKMQ